MIGFQQEFSRKHSLQTRSRGAVLGFLFANMVKEVVEVDRTKGLAYCGLACFLCSRNASCAGCRNEGCQDKDWCKNYTCCRAKGLRGCWECAEFPCSGTRLDKLRNRTFAKMIAEYGEDRFMELLENNHKAGIIYHYEGQICGDYDTPATEEALRHLILKGR
jgi:hypothetical protein